MAQTIVNVVWNKLSIDNGTPKKKIEYIFSHLGVDTQQSRLHVLLTNSFGILVHGSRHNFCFVFNSDISFVNELLVSVMCQCNICIHTEKVNGRFDINGGKFARVTLRYKHNYRIAKCSHSSNLSTNPQFIGKFA